MPERSRTDLARWSAVAVRLMLCERCGAEPGRKCRTVTGPRAGTEISYYVHAPRYEPLADEFRRGWNATGEG